MSASRKPPSVQDYPVVCSAAEAKAHDPDRPALIPVPGHLVRPLVLMLIQLRDPTTRGRMAHAIELQLAGLADLESSLLQAGVAKAQEMLPALTRSPEQVLTALVADETLQALMVNVPSPMPGSFGWPEPVIPLGDGEEQTFSCRSCDDEPLELDAPVLRSRADLLAHDHTCPAYVRLPAELVAGFFWLIEHRLDSSDVGEMDRALSTCLTGWGETELGETDSACMIVGGLRRAVDACNRLIDAAVLLRGRLLEHGLSPDIKKKPRKETEN